MAEKKVNLEVLLNRAKDQEMQHDWSGAEETYVKVLQSVSNQDFFITAEILERKAYAPVSYTHLTLPTKRIV